MTSADWEILDARWLPDGEHLAVVADTESDAGMRLLSERAAAWRLDVHGAEEPSLLAELPGGVAAVRPASDERVMAIVGKDYPRQPSWADNHLYVGDGTTPRRLGHDLDRPVENVTFGDLIVWGSGVSFEWFGPDVIVAQVGDEGRTVPYQFDAGSGEAVPLVAGDIVCNSIAVGGGRLAMVASEGGRATEVYAVENGAMRRLSSNGSDWLEPYRRDPVRHRLMHPDGHAIDTWLIEGRDAPRPGPVVIQIHGGPHAAHGPTPWLEMLALADAGFHVLYPNPRGSSGYGEAFAKAIHGRWGEVDGSDHLHLVHWAVESGLADPQRIGVMGLSGGGYMTNWLLGHHPGRFRAGVSENPVSNWVSWYGGSDLTGYTDERFVGIGRLPEDIEAFLAASPFMKIHQNTAPLLLLQSEDDLRCPAEQSEILFAILRSRGVPYADGALPWRVALPRRNRASGPARRPHAPDRGVVPRVPVSETAGRKTARRQDGRETAVAANTMVSSRGTRDLRLHANDEIPRWRSERHNFRGRYATCSGDAGVARHACVILPLLVSSGPGRLADRFHDAGIG